MTKLSGTAICAFLLLFIMQANAQSDGRGLAIKSPTRRVNVMKANAQSDGQGFVINGTIHGVNSGVVRMYTSTMESVLDSAVIRKGRFVMQGKTGMPERMLFKITPGNWSFPAFVENTAMTFDIDTTGAMHQPSVKGDLPIIWQIKQTGSKIADDYARYQEETGWTYGLSLYKKLKLTKSSTDAAGIKNEMDSIMKLVPGKQKAWVENYIHQNPESVTGVYILNELYRSSLSGAPAEYLRSVINQFSGPAKASIYYRDLTQATTNLVDMTVNSLSPDFTLQKRDKTKFTLSTTRGRYTMVDFWASWCVPCRKAIPNWKKVYAKYHPKGLNIVSVSNDRYWKDWLPALNKEQMPWVQLIDEFPSARSTAKVANLYRVPSLPFYVLLDKEGKVLLASGDEESINKKIEEVLP
jgi:thiol-disulfide isomerase/thioredoxin